MVFLTPTAFASLRVVSRESYVDSLLPADRGGIRSDTEHWSPWFAVRMDELVRAPTPRRYIQFRFEFAAGLFEARQVDELRFDYLQPPLADSLHAEVFPRLAEAEKPATFPLRSAAAHHRRGARF